MNFKNIQEFVDHKFKKEVTTPLALITSFHTTDTIGNVNAALVLADRESQKVPLSKLIADKIKRSVYVQSSRNGTHAAVAIMCYEKK